MSNEEIKSLPEAPVTMFTNYKRTDGFEVSVTLRGNDLKEVATLLDMAIKGIVASGGTPVSRQKTGGFPPKQIDYADGDCPKCGSRLVNASTKDGRKFVKCSTNKWNFAEKKAEGCEYTKWPEMTQADL